MKKIYLFLLALISLCISCKKDKTDASYHITCKVDGIEKTFNTNIVAGKIDDSVHFLMVGGSAAAVNKSGGFGFTILRPGTGPAIGAGTYADSGTGFEMLISQYEGNTDLNYEAGTEEYKYAGDYQTPIANHFQVVITSIDANTASGTFSGDVYPDGNIDNGKKTITEGSFYVKLGAVPR